MRPSAPAWEAGPTPSSSLPPSPRRARWWAAPSPMSTWSPSTSARASSPGCGSGWRRRRRSPRRSGSGVLGVGSLDILAAAAVERAPGPAPRAGGGGGGRPPRRGVRRRLRPRGATTGTRRPRRRVAPRTGPGRWPLARSRPGSSTWPVAGNGWPWWGTARSGTGSSCSAHGSLDLGLADELSAPPPLAQARLARARLASGATPTDPADLVPDYRREADARINWEQRLPPVPSPGPAGTRR